jgi:hypothetical protein
MDDHTEPGRYLRIDVTGRNPGLWKQYRPVLIEKIVQALNQLLDQVIDPERGSILREPSSKLTLVLCDQLAREGPENEKIEAEVRRLYAQIESDSAEARERHARAEALEFTTAVRKLQLVLGGTKAMLIGDPGEEALLFGQQIDEFLKVLKELTPQ